MLYAGIAEYPDLPKCENGQVRPISREVGLSWLAGIIDGEGNIDFSVQEKNCGEGRASYFCPKVRITNTDLRMIRRISEIYVSENLTFFYALNSVKRYKDRKDTWKNQMEITISSQASVKKLLQSVEPYLVNKARMAQLMIDAVQFVQDQPMRGRMSQAGANYTELPGFIERIEEMRNERKWHIDPSTTARKAREVLSW
jgi:hypothetical protein